MTEMGDHIAGYVNSIVFESESSGYKVLDIESEDGLELFTAVGIMPDVEVGEKIEATGRWEEHSTYGEQFSVREYSRSVPDDVESMERYLGSGVIKGVGEALAKRIVETFGEDTFRVIDQEPERLSKVRGISDRKAIEIAEQFAEKAASREAMIYLESLGLTPTMSMRVFQKFGSKTIATVKTNPYLLAERINGISFRKADEIASRSGLPADAPARIRAAIRFVLMEASYLGHTYLPKERLEDELYHMLGLGGELVENAFEQSVMSGQIINKQDEYEERVYLRALFMAETGTARRLADLASGSFSASEGRLAARVKSIEKTLKIELSDEQKEAVSKAYSGGVTVSTGGPGTGKTTIIEVLLSLLDEDGRRFTLAAPTGKAAKRMEEATGRDARTIHRLLEVQSVPDDENSRMVFNRNEEHPLEYDYIIIDEMSMVDISLMDSLLRAIPQGTHLVMLGDQDQLPSVGPGNVLRDIIESNVVPTAFLTHIYRQKGESDIVSNAHRINEGMYPIFDNRHSDFFLMREENADNALKTLVEVVKTRFRKFYPCEPIDDIQVLSPMKKGTLGIRNLNAELQKALNPPSSRKKELRTGETLFREGDKVMQTRNNYEMEWHVVNKYEVSVEEGKGIYNGDTGRVVRISPDGLTVRFDGSRIVTYDVTDLQQLELAYAITIHKSQGTESPVVVLPLLDGPDILMTRNLLYTGITRAKNYVVIIGREETVRKMVDSNLQQVRYSMLAERLREAASLFDELPPLKSAAAEEDVPDLDELAREMGFEN